MRTPKEVIIELVTMSGRDPFGEDTDSLRHDVDRAEKEVTRAKQNLDKVVKRLIMRQDYELEIQATLRYIEELK